MTGWTPDVSDTTIVEVGVIQGVGLGFLFVPLSVATLSTLSPERRAEGAGIYSLSRNIGSGVGISVVNSLLTRNTQYSCRDWATRHIGQSCVRGSGDWAVLEPEFLLWTRRARRLSVTRQAQIIAYIDDYKLLMIATLAVVPLLIIFSKPSRNVAPDHTQVME